MSSSENSSIKSVILVDEKESQVYGLVLNTSGYRWNNGKMMFNYFSSSFEDFISAFGSLRNVNSRIESLTNTFPIALRAVLPNGAYVFERPPFEYTVEMSSKNANSSKNSQKVKHVSEKIWIPWSIYVLTPNDKIHFRPNQIPYDFQVYFSGSKIVDENSLACVVPLPNVFADGRACFGDSIYQITRDYSALTNPNSIKEIFNIYINAFYTGGWNTDVVPSSYTLPALFRYDEFSIPKDHPSYDHYLNFYTRAKKSFKPFSGRDHLVESYINSLKMWSQMSLPEVLDAFDYHIHNTNYTGYVTNVFKDLDSYTNNSFEIFLANNGNSYSGFKMRSYLDLPSQDIPYVLYNAVLTEEECYEILNILIQDNSVQNSQSSEHIIV